MLLFPGGLAGASLAPGDNSSVHLYTIRCKVVYHHLVCDACHLMRGVSQSSSETRDTPVAWATLRFGTPRSTAATAAPRSSARAAANAASPARTAAAASSSSSRPAMNRVAALSESCSSSVGQCRARMCPCAAASARVASSSAPPKARSSLAASSKSVMTVPFCGGARRSTMGRRALVMG